MKKDTQNIITLTETDSTNNYANQLISAGKAEDGTVVMSYFQRRGKGQPGNSWESAPEMNLLASIIIFPAFLPAGNQFYLSKITSLALFEWLGQHVNNVSVKWPNDIYVGNKKIAGILVETAIQGAKLHSAVSGFGLNLNQLNFSESLPNPVSLKQLTGMNYNLKTSALQLREIFMRWYQKLERIKLSEIDTAYHSSLFRINEWSWFQKDGKILEARILGTGEFGHLILETRSGSYSEFAFKEIGFVI